MLKSLVLRRDFSLFNRRLPYPRLVNLAVRNGHETITIHRVRIRQPFFRRSRLVGAFVFTAATFAVVQSLGLKVEVDVKEAQAKNKKLSPSASPQEEGWTTVGQQVDGDEQEEEGEALLFLPTGFSRPKKGRFYKGTDPEWQEFRKLTADRVRSEKIRGRFVKELRTIVAKNPSWRARIGKVDTNKGNQWLEFKFPHGPPVDYERPGIELTENLEWRKATRPVSEVHHDRLEQLLHPKVTANALYKDTTNKAKALWKRFQSYTGWHQKSKTDTVQKPVKPKVVNPQSSASQPKATTPDPASTASTDSQQPGITPSPAPIDGPSKHLGFVLPKPKELTLDLSRFRADFRRSFKPPMPPMPRGSFLITGIVDAYGTRARASFLVVGVYDPKTEKFIYINAQTYHVVDFKQRPRG